VDAVGQSLWRRTRNADGCFGGFRRRNHRDHGCPAFAAEAASAEEAKAVGLHSDQGSQFGSDACQRFCREHHFEPSMFAAV